MEPGLIGGEVNRILANHQKKGKFPVQYKIGPDPSSIDSCMIGGIVNNNSSGMCCGVSQNSYHTLKVRVRGGGGRGHAAPIKVWGRYGGTGGMLATHTTHSSGGHVLWAQGGGWGG